MKESSTRTITGYGGKRYVVGKAMDVLPGDGLGWATVCVEHAESITAGTRAEARGYAVDGGWCPDCAQTLTPRKPRGRPPLEGGRVTIRVRGQWEDGKRPSRSYALSNDHIVAIDNWAAAHTSGNASRALRDMIDAALYDAEGDGDEAAA